jgi:hypothetical protein
MNAKPKKKLCWNCEGSTSFQDENCPYCGVYLSAMNLSGQESNESLFSPPYRMDEDKEEDQEVPVSPFAEKEDAEEPTPEEIAPEEAVNMIYDDGMKKNLLALILLLIGSAFMLFSIALLLFSKNGVLTLHWNGSYWFIYLILGIPMLFFGWKVLEGIKDASKEDIVPEVIEEEPQEEIKVEIKEPIKEKKRKK